MRSQNTQISSEFINEISSWHTFRKTTRPKWQLIFLKTWPSTAPLEPLRRLELGYLLQRFARDLWKPGYRQWSNIEFILHDKAVSLLRHPALSSLARCIWRGRNLGDRSIYLTLSRVIIPCAILTVSPFVVWFFEMASFALLYQPVTPVACVASSC